MCPRYDTKQSDGEASEMLVTVPSAPITIVITVTFIFNCFFLQFSSKVLVFISLFSFFQFYPVVNRNGKVNCSAWTAFFFFCFVFWLTQGLVVWLRLDDPFVSQNFGELWASHSPGWILGCTYTICSYGQIQTFCTIPSGSLTPPSRV